MKMNIPIILAIGFILLISGCVSNSTPPQTNSNVPTIPPNSNPPPVATSPAAGSNMHASVEYVPFTLAAYNQAKAEGKTIFLEFYANWCPICQSQAPALEAAIPKIKSDKLVAFRVNYKDSETDADESDLARQLNITYQHTHIIVQNGQVVWRSNESLNQQDVLTKLGAYA